MRFGHLSDNALGAKQTKLTSNPSRGMSFFFRLKGGIWKKMSEQVSIAEAVNSELASTNNLDKRLIFLRSGTQGAHSTSVPYHGTANRVDDL